MFRLCRSRPTRIWIEPPRCRWTIMWIPLRCLPTSTPSLRGNRREWERGKTPSIPWLIRWQTIPSSRLHQATPPSWWHPRSPWLAAFLSPKKRDRFWSRSFRTLQLLEPSDFLRDIRYRVDQIISEASWCRPNHHKLPAAFNNRIFLITMFCRGFQILRLSALKIRPWMIQKRSDNETLGLRNFQSEFVI